MTYTCNTLQSTLPISVHVHVHRMCIVDPCTCCIRLAQVYDHDCTHISFCEIEHSKFNYVVVKYFSSGNTLCFRVCNCFD